MSPSGRGAQVWGDDDVVFRSLAAPGLDEDDLFAAQSGLSGGGTQWGDGWPSTFPPADEESDNESDRRRRHDEMLRKWTPSDIPPPVA